MRNVYIATIFVAFVFCVGSWVFALGEYGNQQNVFRTIVHGQMVKVIKDKGFYPFLFGTCRKAMLTGPDIQVACSSLFTEKQLEEFKSSRSK